MKKPDRDTRMILLGLTAAALLLPALAESLPMALRLAALLASAVLFVAYAVMYLKDPGRRPRRRRDRRP